jgi:hypothetical protein
MACRSSPMGPPMTGGGGGRTAVSQYADPIGYTFSARIFGKTETSSSQAE